jgi:threonine aldolase
MRIDLRSDTVTKPTPGMLDAMMHAKVGDDVFGEDPTIVALENRLADMFGMEAGLYCPSGTMTNQIAIKAHTQPLDEIICDQLAHIYNYETGGWAFHSGVSIKLIQTERGIIQANQVAPCVQPDQDWLPNSRLLCIENTVNRGGGSVYTLEEMKSLKEVCKNHQLIYHLDGARIFNAIVASDYSTSDLHGIFDSISICLSKGLGAPVGSVLVGSKEFIKKSRKIRKVFGGGMRQAGFMAAAGIYAIEHHVERMKEDHRRAKDVSEMLSALPYVASVMNVETNIIIFSLEHLEATKAFIAFLAQHDIHAVPFGASSVRFVTHLDFTEEMLIRLQEVLKKFSLANHYNL